MDEYTQAKLDQVMDQFDFARVHRVMSALDWGWGDGGVPSVEMMRGEARFLMEVAFRDGGYRSTGGFEALYRHSDGRRWFELRFVAAETSSYME